MKMKKIKDFIIRKLGGITHDENVQNQVNCHALGSYITAFRIREYMQSLNGKPPEEWCRNAYDMVDKLVMDTKAKEVKTKQRRRN